MEMLESQNLSFSIFLGMEGLRYLDFCHDFFGHVEKWLDKKAKIIFKIYDAINWETKDHNTHITLKKQRQSNNEIWSVNRM